MTEESNGISPKIDFVFKSIFGDPRNKDILEDFLGSVTDFKSGELKQIQIESPEIPKENEVKKSSVLDLILTTKNTVIDIEIQAWRRKALIERSLFYWGKMYSEQLQSGENYDRLRRTICINILDFDLLSTEDYHTTCKVRADGDTFPLTNVLELDFLELRKARMAVSHGKAGKLLDWLRFLNFRSSDREELKMLAKKSKSMQKAVDTLIHDSENKKERIAAWDREMFLHDEAQLRHEGREEERIENIRRMSRFGIPVSKIAAILGCPVEEIQKDLQ